MLLPLVYWDQVTDLFISCLLYSELENIIIIIIITRPMKFLLPKGIFEIQTFIA